MRAEDERIDEILLSDRPDYELNCIARACVPPVNETRYRTWFYSYVAFGFRVWALLSPRTEWGKWDRLDDDHCKKPYTCRVTTGISSIDLPGREVRTESGRLYELMGPPAGDPVSLVVIAARLAATRSTTCVDVTDGVWAAMCAVNNRDRNFTPHKLAKRMQQIEDSIARYMDALDTADRTQPVDLQARTTRLQDKLVKLRKQMQYLREIEIELAKQPDQQLSQTDSDARSMATSGRGTGMVGYNVQVAADTKHHLIVATEVINEGHDRGSLWSMAQRSREAVGKDKIELIADRGYFKGPEILACEQAGIKTYVPKPMTSNSKAEGRFSKAVFIYMARDDEYQCPAGQRLPRHHSSVENGLRIDTYYTSVCPQCPIKAHCTTGQERRVRRWEHEAVLDTMQARLDRKPDAMKIRRRTIEHVFGTLKHWMGSAHFLMRTLVHVPTEINLHALAYNLKRVISVLGIAKTMKAIKLAGA